MFYISLDISQLCPSNFICTKTTNHNITLDKMILYSKVPPISLLPYIGWLLCCIGFVLCMSNNEYWIDLVYFYVSQGTSFLQHTCGLCTPDTAKSLQWELLHLLIYTIHDIWSFCLLLFAPSCHTPPSLSVAADFVIYKNYNQIGCCRLPHWSITILHW